jgi:predicted nuclease with RNAse H fold
MRTLGIDLSAQPKETAAWFLTWRDGRAETDRIVTESLTDAFLLELIADADRIAIDAPFGWPDGFVDAVAAWREGAAWPGPEREALRFRETDRVVRRGSHGDAMRSCAL